MYVFTFQGSTVARQLTTAALEKRFGLSRKRITQTWHGISGSRWIETYAAISSRTFKHPFVYFSALC